MLTIYRRHRRSCKQRTKGRKHRHCQCPIWVDGFLGGKEKIQTSQPANGSLLHAKRIRIHRRVGLVTHGSVPFRMERWPALFCKETGASQIVLSVRPEAQVGIGNPAADLKAGKITLCPTLPFTRDEMYNILAAAEKYDSQCSEDVLENPVRLRALVLILRYSGMRIGDAVRMSVSRVKENRLFLYTQKTGVPVNTVLPPFVARVLRATPTVAEDLYFWDGKSKVEIVAGSWRRRLAKLFKLAGVQNGHPHRFRDTFAVELLLAGVPMERVSVLLGHQSVRITERLMRLGFAHDRSSLGPT